jgi:serine/threonine-protein kinase
MARYRGLSWVAVWTMLFMVVAPTTPRRAVLASLASVSAVPVVVGLMFISYPDVARPNGVQFFFWVVFPYLLVVVMAYVGARVVYALGAEVTRARELGSYRLVERLGKGGMGEVWRAHHRLLARPAAIKLINRSLTVDAGVDAAARIRARFEREAQAMASLRSPHTVNLYDFGVADDGGFYYVMELLDGVDTEALVRRFGPVPPPRTISLLSQVCHSLSEAHARGLVHRDIKPANVFLCRQGEDVDFVKVLDFGLVKALTDAPDATPMLTQKHTVHGTPAFIAPEQALGRPDVDGRVDIYATGCLAYWLLTGRYVFTATSPMELLIHHAQSTPVAPSLRSETAIPPELDLLVLRCLAKEPADRPQSARELAQLLGEIPVAQSWTEASAQTWWRQHLPAAESGTTAGRTS